MKQRKSLTDLVPNASADAIDLMTKLLHLNPEKRITALDALEHPYVAKFHNLNNEIQLDYDIIPPVDDDVQLSVDEYRQKLYEMIVQKRVEIKKRSDRNNNHSNVSSTAGRVSSGRNNSSKAGLERKASVNSDSGVHMQQRKSNSMPTSGYGDMETSPVHTYSVGTHKYSAPTTNGYSNTSGVTGHPTKGYEHVKSTFENGNKAYDFVSLPSQKPPIGQFNRTTHTAPSDRKHLKPLNPRRYINTFTNF